MLEKRPALATLTTPVATGAFRLQFDNAEEVELVRESVAFFDELQGRVDLGLRHQGYLFAACTEEGAAAQAELVRAQAGWGLTDVELIDGDAARRRFPYLSANVINARFRQGDGWLQPRALALELAAASGARFRTGKEVTGFLRRGDRVHGVMTDAGPLEAATGEALRLARQEGIRGSATTPYLLAHVARVTRGESVEANKALLVNNAALAARFARAYYS